ncbi:hypothetical protein ABZV91_21850 [Nocardia sp. NPDC004568]|uniref:hypothetical protein n=1 Tax=Nocardia sp. NPDC004568 TaxID=3154551 RepID=UPI0033A5D16E
MCGPPTLRVANYAANLRRLGYTDQDLAGSGSDALIDALTAHGDAATVAAGLTAHLEAGANQVGMYPLGFDPIATLRGVADAFFAVHTPSPPGA